MPVSGRKKVAAPSAATAPKKLVKDAMQALKQKATSKDMENLARFGIAATNPLGVSMANIQAAAKEFGRNHELAAALWETNCYEARMLAAFVGDPTRLTPAQMDDWCRGFDNWGIVDTLCFCLFDRSPHAWSRVAKWASSKKEFVKRAGYALLASLALHDKKAPDQLFLETFPLIERDATDGRNFVKKGISWALRSLGRRNAALNKEALALARRLAKSDDPSARWIGKESVRELSKKAPKQ